MNEVPFRGKNGRVYKYGEFFPAEISLFAYNESVAQDFFPLTREQAISQGFSWKDAEARRYVTTKTADQLPATAKEASDDILLDVIACSHGGLSAGGCNHQCTTAFKLIPAELAFYRRMQLPLPILCPNCRHYERLAKRNRLMFGTVPALSAPKMSRPPTPQTCATPEAPARRAAPKSYTASSVIITKWPKPSGQFLRIVHIKEYGKFRNTPMNSTQTKNCQNCKKDFTIEPEPQYQSRARYWTSLIFN